jgi:hypothetical protein
MSSRDGNVSHRKLLKPLIVFLLPVAPSQMPQVGDNPFDTFCVGNLRQEPISAVPSLWPPYFPDNTCRRGTTVAELLLGSQTEGLGGDD